MEPTGVAVVTGASRGIGRATALELARAGFEVVATMRDPAAGAGLAEQAQRERGRLRVERLDVTDRDTIRLPAGLRVLVNNAGLEGEHHPVESTPMALWRKVFETNVFGLIAVTAAALPLLRDAGGGVICNLTSSSLFAPMPFFAPYRASKAAVAAIDESLRAEVAQFGIRVVEIMPGPIDTDMYEQSEQPMGALEHPAYAALAQTVTDLKAHSRAMLHPVEAAARAIVAAILDDQGPMRHGCDPLSVAMLEQWRHSSDEEMMSGMLAAFTPREP